LILARWGAARLGPRRRPHRDGGGPRAPLRAVRHQLSPNVG